ncbi:GNAT family N-acetyltransferase [Streptomyces sp. TRM 70351]|uniref:GNAT family N-acetyltransferase n=1 Tax=Streptomyces sp. TRM 70351 TaxID=3116552 RepID=UPI002E7B4F31|nr:GNAT family N-acetyltransferase [Streptomyces sp. TRM 70351]MEE1929212.1 GNAT family N-acetyltransferase [Streptomyces sp. TRM 70351]
MTVTTPRAPAVRAAGATTRPGDELTVSLCRDPERFAALAPRWHALHRRCREATPFQSHAWLHSWWLSYGRPGRLRLVLVHEGERLVAAAPLMLVHRPLPALVPLGGTISDFSDVLLDASCPGAAPALLAGLRRAARGAVIDLREVRPGAAAERLFRDWTGPRSRLCDSVCLELPGAPVHELLERLPSRNARRFRAKLRRLEALGVEERVVPAEEVPDAVATLLRLHALQWRGRGVTPEHLRPRFAAHLARAARRMAETGDAAVTEYRIDGRVVATDVTLLSAELAGGYLYGADPGLRERKVDITAMLLRHDARQVAESGRRVLSLLRGTEPYKQHWRPVTVTNQRLLLARRRLTPALRLLTAQAAGRAAAAHAVRTRLPAARRWYGGLTARLHAAPAVR